MRQDGFKVKQISETELKKRNQQEAIEQLREMLNPGDTIYTINRHVSRSGMMRRISCFIVGDDKKIMDIDWLIARTGLFKRSKDGGLIANGCGMDMHYHIVYELGRILYPQGFKLAKGQYGRNGDTSGYDTDGGYAFNKESL